MRYNIDNLKSQRKVNARVSFLWVATKCTKYKNVDAFLDAKQARISIYILYNVYENAEARTWDLHIPEQECHHYARRLLHIRLKFVLANILSVFTIVHKDY